MEVTYDKNLSISVVTGGEASERPGSLQSGETMKQALRAAGFRKVETFDLTKHSFPEMVRSGVELAYLALHGGYGENGALQGALELLDMPYTGPGVGASAISSDKSLFNAFVRSAGYLAPAQHTLSSMEDLDRPIPVRFPAVVKPSTQGCSYGVFLVDSLEDLRKKAAFSFEFGRVLVLEEFIDGREITVGVFADPDSDGPRVLPIAETVLYGKKIIDFEVKAPQGEKFYETVIPSSLSEALREKVVSACRDIFVKLGCKGHVRFDIRIDAEERLFFLENNTSPGMLNPHDSDFPKMLLADGISLAEFADKMVRDAIRDFNGRQKTVPSGHEMKAMINTLKSWEK